MHRVQSIEYSVLYIVQSSILLSLHPSLLSLSRSNSLTSSCSLSTWGHLTLSYLLLPLIKIYNNKISREWKTRSVIQHNKKEKINIYIKKSFSTDPTQFKETAWLNCQFQFKTLLLEISMIVFTNKEFIYRILLPQLKSVPNWVFLTTFPWLNSTSLGLIFGDMINHTEMKIMWLTTGEYHKMAQHNGSKLKQAAKVIQVMSNGCQMILRPVRLDRKS